MIFFIHLSNISSTFSFVHQVCLVQFCLWVLVIFLTLHCNNSGWSLSCPLLLVVLVIFTSCCNNSGQSLMRNFDKVLFCSSDFLFVNISSSLGSVQLLICLLDICIGLVFWSVNPNFLLSICWFRKIGPLNWFLMFWSVDLSS